MELKKLYDIIGLQEQVIKRLEFAAAKIETETVTKYTLLLTDPNSYECAERELEKLLHPDRGGFKILYVMLRSALISYDKYVNKHIPDDIFTASMKSFTRFISETMESFGEYGYDRAWWSGRFLSLLIFRIGELEYEILYDDSEISIHIPSDADLSKADESIADSKRFFAEFFPNCKNWNYTCLSWLLSPSLDLLLDKQSKILEFKSKFKITDVYPDDEGYKKWVFKNPNLLPQGFPENTSLQRTMKNYILCGGKIGEAKGVLI